MTDEENPEASTDSTVPNVPILADGTDRRRLLAAMAGGGSLSVAGCLGLFAEPQPLEGPSDDEDENEDDDFDGETYSITYDKQGETIDVREDTELLIAGEEQGWDLPYNCRQGICGECSGKVNGDGFDLVEMANNEFLTEDEVEEGYVLTCQSQPRDDFVLRTGEKPDREYDVEYVKQEETLTLPGANPPEPGEMTLLEAGLEQDWDMPHREECKEGWCGECTAKVDGAGHEKVWMWDNEYLDQREIDAGYVLTCTGYPLDHMALETGEQPDLEPVGEVEEHDVEFLNEDVTISIPEDTAMLIAGEEEGLDLPYNCRRGVCGRCTGKIDEDVNEAVEMTNNDVLPQELIDEGYTLTCTGQPRDEFAIETDVYSEIRDEL